MNTSKHLLPLLALTAALLGSCGSTVNSSDPMVVAEAFYEQMAAGNVEAAKSLSTPETAEMLDYIAANHCTQMFEQIARGGASNARVEDSSARVRFVEGGGYATVPLVKVDGEWKVDFATMMKAHMKPRPTSTTL